LNSFFIPIPPYEEQKRLLAKINELEPIIAEYDKYEQEERTLDEELPIMLRKSILQYAIQGKLVPQDPTDEPASVLLERIRNERKASSGGKKSTANSDSIIYKNSDDNSYYPFDIPESWSWCKLEDICEINPQLQANNDTMAGFVPMKLICEGYRNNFIFEVRKWKDVKNGFTHFADGDIGFAKITPCFQNCKSVIFDGLPNGIGAGTTELHILRPYEGISAEYLLWFVKSPYFIEYGKEHFIGTAGQQRFQTSALKKIFIPVPPTHEQCIIGKAITEMVSLIPDTLIMRK
jgi:type I restriction enzyme S subunit